MRKVGISDAPRIRKPRLNMSSSRNVAQPGKPVTANPVSQVLNVRKCYIPPMSEVRPIVLGATLLIGVLLGFPAVALSKTPSLPKEMAEEVSEDTGEPVVMRQLPGITWGLSTKPVSYGDPIPVLLWLYNPTDKPQGVTTCGDIDNFWEFDINVADSAGRRMLTRAEQKQARNTEIENLPLCGRNLLIWIPPHTCIHGTFSKLEHDFARDLNEYYSLPPGKYLITPAEKKQNGKRLTRSLTDLQRGLLVEVDQP